MSAGTLSAFRISSAIVVSVSVQMLTNAILSAGRDADKSASRLLLILDRASAALQKFTKTYLPLSMSRFLITASEESSIAGASLPISSEWLP